MFRKDEKSRNEALQGGRERDLEIEWGEESLSKNGEKERGGVSPFGRKVRRRDPGDEAALGAVRGSARNKTSKTGPFSPKRPAGERAICSTERRWEGKEKKKNHHGGL